MKSNHKRRGKAWFEQRPWRLVPQDHEGAPGSRREHASMVGKHRKWPLGTVVAVTVQTPDGSKSFGMVGKIHKHDGSIPHGAWVEFEHAKAIKDDPWDRFSHVISFARMHRMSNHTTEA